MILQQKDQNSQTSKEVLRTEHVYDGFMATASVETANVGNNFHHKSPKAWSGVLAKRIKKDLPG
jgi:hypothetical protein